MRKVASSMALQPMKMRMIMPDRVLRGLKSHLRINQWWTRSQFGSLLRSLESQNRR